jgi:hypothetical protein
MNIQQGALLWLVVIILVGILAYWWGLSTFASITLAVLVGMIVFMLAVSGNVSQNWQTIGMNGLSGFMGLMMAISMIIVLVFLFFAIFKDRRAPGANFWSTLFKPGTMTTLTTTTPVVA